MDNNYSELNPLYGIQAAFNRAMDGKANFMDNQSVAVCLPTRGTIFSETVASVIANITASNLDFNFYIATKPIPDSFNETFSYAIRDGCTYIWVVEDDIVPPLGTLSSMVTVMNNNKMDVLVGDYPLDTGKTHIKKYRGEFLYAGTGCILVRTAALKKMKKPFFSVSWDFVFDEKTKSFSRIKAPMQKRGGQDAHFFIQAIRAGLRVGCLPIMCKHLRLVKLGDHLSNNGLHEIQELQWKK